MPISAIDFRPISLRSATMLAVVMGSGIPRIRQAGEVAFIFDGSLDAPATVTLLPAPYQSASQTNNDRVIGIILARTALEMMFEWNFPSAPERFHLTQTLRAIVLTMKACRMSGQARQLYLQAKGTELLCDTIVALTSSELVTAAATNDLRREDTTRMLAARAFVEQNWRNKLTIDQISRACGMSRTKLTLGFRALFGRSVYEMIAARRFEEAKLMLATTDKHVASIAYEVGYEDSASFTRAFGKHVGIAPAKYREAFV